MLNLTRRREGNTYAFRALVQSLLVFLRLADALRVALVLGRPLEGCAAVDACERGLTLISVVIKLWLLHDIAAT